MNTKNNKKIQKNLTFLFLNGFTKGRLQSSSIDTPKMQINFMSNLNPIKKAEPEKTWLDGLN